MSRSRKKTPIFGNCGGSEKHDKSLANRRLRRMTREAIRKEVEPPRLEEVSSTWTMNKDGKHYWHEATDRDMNK